MYDLSFANNHFSDYKHKGFIKNELWRLRLWNSAILLGQPEFGTKSIRQHQRNDDLIIKILFTYQFLTSDIC